MNSFELIIDANVIAFHLFDYASKWDYHIHPNLNKWLLENIQEKEELEKLFTEYVPLRQNLGWKKETALFQWARRGFDDEFPEIKKIIACWMKLHWVDSTKTIPYIAIEKAEEIKGTQIFLLESLERLKLEEKIADLKKLFPEHKQVEAIPSFIVWGPVEGSITGGASGDGVFSEMNLSPQPVRLGMTFSTLIHELCHKILSPSKTMSLWKELKSIDKEYGHIMEGNHRLTAYLEELVIYGFVNVHMFKEDAKEKIKNYKDWREQYHLLWIDIEKFYPILQKFLQNKNVETTRQEIIDFAKDLVRNK